MCACVGNKIQQRFNQKPKSDGVKTGEKSLTDAQNGAICCRILEFSQKTARRLCISTGREAIHHGVENRKNIKTFFACIQYISANLPSQYHNFIKKTRNILCRYDKIEGKTLRISKTCLTKYKNDFIL